MCDVLINAGHNDTSLELDFSDLFPQFAVRNLENNAEGGGGRDGTGRDGRVKLILTLVMCKNP